MFSTDFIFRQQENLVDNQKCQAGFRPLCNKILFLLTRLFFQSLKNSVGHCTYFFSLFSKIPLSYLKSWPMASQVFKVCQSELKHPVSVVLSNFYILYNILWVMLTMVECASSRLVFCYQNCSGLTWERFVLVIEKTFWNSRLKAEALQNFWALIWCRGSIKTHEVLKRETSFGILLPFCLPLPA